MLYGSQYYAIWQKGGDASKGRQNANAFLTMLIIMLLVAIGLFLHKFFPDFLSRPGFLRNFRSRSATRITALMAFGVVYAAILLTVGSEKSFRRYVAAFMEYPEEIKKRSQLRLLVPFLALLLVICCLLIFL